MAGSELLGNSSISRSSFYYQGKGASPLNLNLMRAIDEQFLETPWYTTGELKVPNNITLLFLPSRAPELNPVENLWQFLRQTYLSNRTFETYQDILDAACEAWNRIIDQPWRITSIGLRDWAHNGHSF